MSNFYSNKINKTTNIQNTIELVPNELEIKDKICDLSIPYLSILEARGSGKSFASAYGLLELAVREKECPIGVFAPKWAQAGRLIAEAQKIAKLDSDINNEIDWNSTTNTKVVFKNTNYIQGLSANRSTYSEGWHWAVMLVDEAMRVSDYVYKNILLPQVGSYKIAKIIKLGTSMFKNHFHHSCNEDKKYLVLKKDYTECDRLLVSGTIPVKDKNGNIKEYSKYVLDRMPLSLKRKFFPDNSELHFEGDMDEVEFLIAYMMEWCLDINNFLTVEDQKILRENGKHNWLNRGIYNEVYCYGLDTAPGSLINTGSKKIDHSSLSIYRIKENIKEKVYGVTWQGHILKQKEEIISLVHPKDGIFPCKYGIIEYANIGISFVAEFKEVLGFPVEGILFNMTEPISRKNFKNAMFEHFRDELRNSRLFYPHKVDQLSQPNLQDSIIQWEHLIRKIKGSGVNAIIEADENYHDDIPVSDVLAVYACDNVKNFAEVPQAYDWPIAIGPNARVIGHVGNQPSRYVTGR